MSSILTFLQYDVTLAVSETNEGLHCNIAYWSSRVPEEQAIEIMDAIEAMLGLFLQDPNKSCTAMQAQFE